ncbi:MAG: hypothetical protein ACI9MX_003901 [Candidatus Aldehydirespiratoraceae bacterium]
MRTLPFCGKLGISQTEGTGMSAVRATIGLAVVALVLSLSVATSLAAYPPTDPPDGTPTTIATEVGGVQETNDPDLAITGASFGTATSIGAALMISGLALWFVSQRRQPQTS